MSPLDAPAREPPAAPVAAGPGLLSRVAGIVVSPVDTFGHISRDPRPVGMLVLVSLVSAAVTTAFFATETGRLAWLDTTLAQQESFGRTISDAQYAVMERVAGLLVYIVPAYTLVVGPLVSMVIAGLLKVGFAVIAGAEATFKQVLGVVAASGVILLLRALFVLPINYAQESMRGASNLAVLLPMLPPDGFAASFLGMIDLFAVWWVAVLAAGLAVLYRRSAWPIGVTFFSLYGAIAVAIALVRVWAGGS